MNANIPMRAALTTTYGPAEVLEVRDVPRPTPGAHEVLVEVHASPVTAGDQRLRAADFPGIMALFGRLLLGLLRPRRAVQGTNFAGRIVAVGREVTRYAVGDDVFGMTPHGAYAEYLVVPEDGPMARKPARLGYDEAAALPYGAVTALHFVRDLGAVRPGDKVLVLGASGGVGRFAVQIAKHLGAEVTGVCSAGNFELVRGLGADHVLDHRTTDFTRLPERYDVIFDVAGVSTFSRSRSSLSGEGRYLTLFMSIGLVLQMLVTGKRRGPKAKSAIVLGDRNQVEQVRELAERGVLRPVLAQSFPLERIAEAHAARAVGTVTVALRSSAAVRSTPAELELPVTDARRTVDTRARTTFNGSPRRSPPSDRRQTA
jgi:NADPH:quinone reductase-like Zn-dependent oxidoreductase